VGAKVDATGALVGAAEGAPVSGSVQPRHSSQINCAPNPVLPSTSSLQKPWLVPPIAA
jgi:hypothetical protein